MKKGKIISAIAVCLVLFYACENNEQVITSQDVAGAVVGSVAGGVTGVVAASNGASTLCDNIDKIQGDNGKK